MPYEITNNLIVKGTDGADGITTLIIEPGVLAKFSQCRYMDIGAASGDPGAIVAQGTDSDPIVFTSNKDTPTPGDWYGIRIYNTADDTNTLFEHCVVEYTGYSNNGAIRIQDSSPTLRNCIFLQRQLLRLVLFRNRGWRGLRCAPLITGYYFKPQALWILLIILSTTTTAIP